MITKVLTASEVQRIKNIIKNDIMWSLVFDLMLHYFLSPIEICRLKQSDFVYENNSEYIVFLDKSKRLPLVKSLSLRLKSYLCEKQNNFLNDYLFVNEDQTPLKEACILTKIEYYCQMVGLETVDRHYLVNDTCFKPEDIVHISETKYQIITVIETKGLRYVITDYSISGVMKTEEPSLFFLEHQNYIRFLELLDIKPKKILVLGGGVQIITRYFSHIFSEAIVEVCEIDVDVTRIATNYFYFNDLERIKVHHQDAFDFLKETNEQFDIIFFDIPLYDDAGKLFCCDNLQLYSDLLSEKGILIYNILGYLNTIKANYDTELLKGLFKKGYIFSTEETNVDNSQNFIMFLLKTFENIDMKTLEKVANRKGTGLSKLLNNIKDI